MKTIPLTRGYSAIVDDEDYKRVSKYRWCVCICSGIPYARSWMRGLNEYLHRFIANPDDGKLVDHINGNGLDCRRSNLRICDSHKNSMNRRGTKKLKGVRKSGPSSFKAAIKVSGKQFYSRSFGTEIEAAHAYDQLALLHFGEFARLNFQQEH